jgi:gamma-glutamyl-gamma-aminobutyrate hydrolase PuuD
MNIGLSQRVLLHKKRAYDALEQGWYSFFNTHTLFPIANRPNQNFESIAHQLDCFVITGGNDSTIRRLTEIRLAHAMMVLQKPVIGICHGCFLLTDILGGQIGNISGHADVTHNVSYFSGIKHVNSYHTLYIKRPHTKATVLVNDDQGNCEAWIDGNLAGIVWHPERMLVPWIPNEIAELFDK